jgi:hypothetical protein
MPENEDLGPQFVQVTRRLVSASVKPLAARVDRVEARLAAVPDQAAMERVANEAVARLPAPRNGKDAEPVDPVQLRAIVGEEVARAIADMPRPADGKDATPEQIRAVLLPELERAIAALPKPKDGVSGASIHPDTVALMVRDAVDKAVAALPPAKDGEPGRDAAALAILPGIDETRSYAAGTWAKHANGLWLARAQTSAMAGWECIVAGVAGVAFDCGAEREISLSARLSDGTVSHETFRLPVMIYRGVWRESEHDAGDVVTWAGSAWHCQHKTNDKPGDSDAWKLMVKHGAPGKSPEQNAPAMRDVVRVK